MVWLLIHTGVHKRMRKNRIALFNAASCSNAELTDFCFWVMLFKSLKRWWDQLIQAKNNNRCRCGTLLSTYFCLFIPYITSLYFYDTSYKVKPFQMKIALEILISYFSMIVQLVQKFYRQSSF